MTRRLLRRVGAAWPLLALAALVLAVHAEALLPSRVLFYRDLGMLMHPVLEDARAADGGRTVAVPAWSHAMASGRTLVGNPGYALLNPASVLYLVLPFDDAFDGFLVLHVLIAGLAALVACRRLGLSAEASLAGGLAYALGGGAISALALYWTLVAVAWAPLVVVLGLAASERPTALRIALVALVLGLQANGGQPEPVLATVVVGAMLSLAQVALPWPRRIARVAWTWAATGAWAGLLAAPQLLPAAVASRSTLRSYGFTVDGLLYNSLDPRALPGLVLRRWGGHPMDRLEGGFPGGAWTDSGTPYFLSLHVGLVASALALLALVVAVRSRPASGDAPSAPSRALVVALGLAALAGIVVALGRHVPGVHAVLEALPLRMPLRYPVKAAQATFLAVPFLAAIGVEALRRRHGPRLALLAALVLGLDLASAHAGYAPTIDRAELDAPPLAAHLAAVSDGVAPRGSWRVHHQRQLRGEWGPPAGTVAPTEQAVHAWRRRMLMPPSAAAHGIRSAMEPTGDLMDDLEYFSLAKDLHARAPPAWAAGLGQAGVLWVVAPSPGLAASTEGVLRLEAALDERFGVPAGSGWLYRNLRFVPRFALASSPAWPLPRALGDLGDVRLVEEDAAGLELEVRALHDAWVVVTDAIGPPAHWEVSVDGTPVPHRRVRAFLAFPVDAGRHVVRVDYLAPGLRLGSVLALLAAAAAFGVLSLARVDMGAEDDDAAGADPDAGVSA